VVLPDPDDRHVAALAAEVGASVIVTKNLRDFPQEELDKWHLSAVDPDPLLERLARDHPSVLLRIAEEIAASWHAPDALAEDVIARLGSDAPKASQTLMSALTPDGKMRRGQSAQ
jgi:hypothetical protein